MPPWFPVFVLCMYLSPFLPPSLNYPFWIFLSNKKQSWNFSYSLDPSPDLSLSRFYSSLWVIYSFWHIYFLFVMVVVSFKIRTPFCITYMSLSSALEVSVCYFQCHSMSLSIIYVVFVFPFYLSVSYYQWAAPCPHSESCVCASGSWLIFMNGFHHVCSVLILLIGQGHRVSVPITHRAPFLKGFLL